MWAKAARRKLAQQSPTESNKVVQKSSGVEGSNDDFWWAVDARLLCNYDWDSYSDSRDCNLRREKLYRFRFRVAAQLAWSVRCFHLVACDPSLQLTEFSVTLVPTAPVVPTLLFHLFLPH